MRRSTKVSLTASAAVLALAGISAPPAAGAGRSADDTAAYFQAADYRDTFVLKITDPKTIAHARALLDGSTTDQPHVMGRIVKTQVAWNSDWSFHINPETVRFFDFAIEVCDSSVRYTEDHLDEAGGPFLPGLYWCPWSSRLVKELPAD